MPENGEALLFTYPNGLQWEEIVFILCFCHYHSVPSRDLAHLLLQGGTCDVVLPGPPNSYVVEHYPFSTLLPE